MQWVANKKIGKDIKKFNKKVQKRIFLLKNSQSTKNDIDTASEKYDEIWKKVDIYVISFEKMTLDWNSKTARKSELSLLKKYDLIIKKADKNKNPKESKFALNSGENINNAEYVKIKIVSNMRRFRSFFMI